MNFNQLRFARAVADTGSFTAAAEACFVTQPTLSNGLAQLEEELGERLFVRTTRKVALTPFGEHLLPYLAEVLNAQDIAVQQAQAFLSPDKQLIRIGTSPLINARLLRLMLEPFQRQHPKVDIVLREMNMQDLYRMLEDGLLDFVLGVAGLVAGPWQSSFLYEEPLLFLPRGAPWQGSASVQFKDIAQETFVMVPNACGLSQTVRALFRSSRRALHEYAGAAMSYQVLEEWAALGIGAAILPQSKVSKGAKAALPILDKSGEPLMLRYEASWPQTGAQLAHLRAFSSHLRLTAPGLLGGMA